MYTRLSTEMLKQFLTQPFFIIVAFIEETIIQNMSSIV